MVRWIRGCSARPVHTNGYGFDLRLEARAAFARLVALRAMLLILGAEEGVFSLGDGLGVATGAGSARCC